MIRAVLLCFFLVAGVFGTQTQQQNPSATDQKAKQADSSGQKPSATPGQSAPGQQGAQPQQGARSSEAVRQMIRGFLAIGAPPDTEAEKRGQATFVQTCGFCHGTNATGGAQGPNLVRSTLVLHDQGSGKEIGPVIHDGRLTKGMPAFANFTDAQIHDIAQFLLGRTQAAANRMEYSIQNIVTGDPKTGEAYFQVHCATCHSATGDLAHIAAKYEPVTLEGRFLYPGNMNRFGMGPPPDSRAEKHVTVTVPPSTTLPSGVKYSGVLAHIDDFSVGLRDSSGVYRSWTYDDAKGIQVQIQDPLEQHLKLLHEYSDADMHNILAYLETLK
ncbi:c-type cytochrome [Acidicapsa dinghuensis]|uniref:C-type cytochrome n=1 Tax=Acidicapsa dinghuensis TaxID=2218256 RepID=A0ABW1EHM8_9BACT|nr:cytochrome c [Acidicapsa dinghuensis]